MFGAIAGGIASALAGGAKIGRAVQQECRDRSRMPSSAGKIETLSPLGLYCSCWCSRRSLALRPSRVPSFSNVPASTDLHTLSLHDALPISATKCRGLVSLNQVIKEIICLQPLK